MISSAVSNNFNIDTQCMSLSTTFLEHNIKQFVKVLPMTAAALSLSFDSLSIVRFNAESDGHVLDERLGL